METRGKTFKGQLRPLPLSGSAIPTLRSADVRILFLKSSILAGNKASSAASHGAKSVLDPLEDRAYKTEQI
ncbi:MAG: hypothetical protein EXS02_10190 [Planctomycetes bacterium]|nr:hypothetical protein [Planctomycetota bacterium]